MAAKWEGKSLVGGRLGQFEVKDEIARGGMGVVYKGYQPSLDRWVAIKTLPIDLAGDRDLVARFQREAEAMVRLNHANIVQIIDRGEDTGQYYFAMEFVEGPSVKDLLKSETIDKDKVFDILTQTCEGLEYAHKKGLVHRDIKPANLLFEEKTGTVKIADFGIAHFSKKDEDMLTLTADNVGMGTMNYMSPEQKVNAKSVDHKSDIYALGVIIYEAFTGKLPLGKFKLPSEVNPKLPRQLDTIVQKCLEAEPADRYDSCATLKAALLEAKAATHDKTLQRSMREAFDRTLTAFGPNKSVGCAVLGLIFLVLAGGAVTGVAFFLRGRGAKARLEKALADVARSKKHAEALHANREQGKASYDEGTSAEASAQSSNDALKADYLEKALRCYDEAASAVIVARKDEASGVQKKIDALRENAKAVAGKLGQAAQTQLDEASAAVTAARRVLDEAEKPEGTIDAFSLDAANQKLTGASGFVDRCVRLAKDETSLRAKLDQIKPDAPERADIDAALKRLVQARDDGNLDAASSALTDAAALASKATGTPVVEPSPAPAASPGPGPGPSPGPAASPGAPSPAPTPVVAATMDPANDPLVRSRLNSVVEEAGTAHHDAGAVLDVARELGIKEGAADFDSAQAGESSAMGLAPREAIKTLEAARDGFRKAASDGLAALAARRDKARAAAEPARDTQDYADAAALDTKAREGEPGKRAQALRAQIVGFDAAAETAQKAARKAADAARRDAEAARASALARLGDGAAGLLAAGDAALDRGKKALEGGQLATAKDELASAVSEYSRATWPTPTSVTFPESDADKARIFATKLIGPGAAISAIAGCPKGFVVSYQKQLLCFDPSFHTAILPASTPPISALCSGDGDDVYAATIPFDGKGTLVLRFSTGGTKVERAPTLPGALGEDRGRYKITALAYDVRSRTLFAAQENRQILTFNAASGEAGRILDLRETKVVFPTSLAVLSDGSVVVCGETVHGGGDGDDLPRAESKWRFAVYRFKSADKGYDRAESYEPDETAAAAPIAVASAGDGLVALEHADQGRLWIWPRPTSISQPPEPALQLQVADANKASVLPKWGSKIAVYGRRAYVLDVSPADVASDYSLFRGRLKVFDLKN